MVGKTYIKRDNWVAGVLSSQLLHLYMPTAATRLSYAISSATLQCDFYATLESVGL